ncbi:MAG TPA: hypothetical protein VFP10_15455, partial [Candidatus Eisenbacteria bacterium]|nr:hypothetical protein [Candidatus Eisenbacteria bacterium]
ISEEQHVAKKKVARKTSARRSPAKKAKATKRAKRTPAPRGVNLKKVREDLVRAIEAMRKRPVGLAARAVPDSAVARLEEAVARIDEFCTEDQGCGSTMIVPDPTE